MRRPTHRLRHALVALLLALTGLASTTASAETPTKRSYTIVVAHNGSVDEGVAPLRYADDDGARYYELFSSMTDSAHLLTTLDADSQRVFPGLAGKTLPPTRTQLTETVAALSARIRADREAGIQTELYLVFTGHGNIDEHGEGYLSLQDGKLRRSDLYREVIRPLDANFTHLIIDACHAYFMVQSRGGEWQDDRSGQTRDDAFEAYVQGREKTPAAMSTVGVILSTAGTAEVHEWSKFRAGVFSHQLRSGLLGAADVDGDGAVSYPEIQAFLAAANAGVTNPRARIRVHAAPPAQDRRRALTSIDGFRDASILTLDQVPEGRLHIEDPRGLRYADLHVHARQRTRLALLRESQRRAYFLRSGDRQARISTSQDAITSSELAFAQREDQARGAVEESFRTELFSVPFGPQFFAGFSAGQEQTEAQLEQKTRPIRDTSPWSMGFDLEYGLGSSTLFVEGDPELGTRGLQHNLAATFLFAHQGGLELGPYLGYGFSNLPGSEWVQRFGGGAELSYTWNLWRSIWVAPRARLGAQYLLQRRGSSQDFTGDPTSLRAEGTLLIGLGTWEHVSLRLHAGLGGDFVSRVERNPDGTFRNEDQWFWTPLAGLGLRF